MAPAAKGRPSIFTSTVSTVHCSLPASYLCLRARRAGQRAWISLSAQGSVR